MIFLNIFSSIYDPKGLARNLDQPEVKDWLRETKECLMGEKAAKDQEKENKKLNEFLER